MTTVEKLRFLVFFNLKSNNMRKIAILFITTTAFLFSCSTDDEVVPSSNDLAGRYVILETPDNDIKSVYANDSTLSFLGVRGRFGTRTRVDRNYEMVSEKEILIDNTPYSVDWDENKLSLLESDGTPYLVLLREASRPTAEEWVTTIDPESKIQQSTFVDQTRGEKISDMTYYNGYVYTNAHRDLEDENVLTEINPIDFSITQLPIPLESKYVFERNDNISYVGSNKFWVYNSGGSEEHMYEYNVNSLEETNNILMPERLGSLYQLGSNGTRLFGTFIKSVREWNFVEQKWGNEIDLGILNPTNGINLDNEYLYVGSYSTIHKYSLNPLKAVGAYDIYEDGKYKILCFTITSNKQVVASVLNFESSENEIVTFTLP